MAVYPSRNRTEVGDKLAAIRKFSIDTAVKAGCSPDKIVETAKKIEEYITGGDITVTVTTD